MEYIEYLQNILFFISKVCLASGIGILLGQERRKHKKHGGARTFAIICVSACLVSILSVKLYAIYKFDFVRLMSYCIVGISFLGSGIINTNTKKGCGITSASALFLTVILGFYVGLGFILVSLFISFLLWIILESKYRGI
jgi:putative Mg2+ transporter-C (MgtC) family protein